MLSKKDASYAIVHFESIYTQPRTIQAPTEGSRRVLRKLGDGSYEKSVREEDVRDGMERTKVSRICETLERRVMILTLR